MPLDTYSSVLNLPKFEADVLDKRESTLYGINDGINTRRKTLPTWHWYRHTGLPCVLSVSAQQVDERVFVKKVKKQCYL